MKLNPLFIPAEPVAGVEDRWVPVGCARQIIQRAAAQMAKSLKVRVQMGELLGIHIEFEQPPKAIVDRKKFMPRQSPASGVASAVLMWR